MSSKKYMEHYFNNHTEIILLPTCFYRSISVGMDTFKKKNQILLNKFT